MRPSEFQDTADRLAQGVTQGDWRSAISRAYYAVFHHFREFCLAHGLDLGQAGQAHHNLYIGLNNCGVGGIPAIASKVNDLRKTRAEADYDLMVSIGSGSAASAAQQSRKIVADFQALFTTVPAQQIVDGAKQHLRSIRRIP